MADNIHAACLSLNGHGVLIIGAPGSGKSDLALQFLAGGQTGQPFGGGENTLIADDQVILSRQGDDIIAAVPDTIAGKLEVRGLGIIAVAYAPQCPLDLIVSLHPSEDIDRLPDGPFSSYELLGLQLPMIKIDAKTASAKAKIQLALSMLPRRNNA